MTRRKVRPCQGDKAERKWQGQQGQSTWEPPGRSWGSQPLTPEFSHPSLLLLSPSALHATCHTPRTLACRFLRAHSGLSPRSPLQFRASSTGLHGVCFAAMRVSAERPKASYVVRDGAFSPCLLQLKAKNSVCSGQWKEHCARSQVTLV